MKRTCIVIAILALLSGCVMYPKPVYSDIYALGPAEKVTEWALEQVRSEQIAGGIWVLTDFYQFSKREQTADAMRGLREIHAKLVGGWPGIQPAPYDDPHATSATLEQDLREYLLELLRERSQHPEAPPEVRQTYLELSE